MLFEEILIMPNVVYELAFVQVEHLRTATYSETERLQPRISHVRISNIPHSNTFLIGFLGQCELIVIFK